jgi:predicted  nucleic acid-binding Zn-ribbon protein
MKIKLIAITSLLLFCWLSGSCAPGRDFDACLNSIVEPYRFSIAKWESVAIPREVNRWIFDSYKKSDDEVRTVTEYFSSVERIKTLKSEIQAINAGNRQGDLASLEAELNRLQEQRMALEGAVEKIIERQIREVLAQQGIFNPMDEYVRLEVGFPPVNFELEKLPCLLVISPRHKIESMREILLLPNLGLKEIEDIEAKVDKLGISSLVVELGGLSTPYPTLVANEASLRFTIDTATEEWLHQYLVFKPLGFLYLLDLTGASRNYEIATMNETLASMISKEIGSIVYEKYYPGYENGVNQKQTAESEFDFNHEMREIRKAVDKYLAQGEIERAEECMEQKRQYLASMGHYIRKLNQAYFAFHGTYADRPTSISPIGLELKELRSQSASLKDFLDTVAGITSRQELRDSLR